MPKVVDLTNAAIYVYHGDHAPPHFHVLGPDSDAQIAIANLQVIRGRISRRDLGEAVAYAAEHTDDLETIWRQYHERD